MTTPRRSAPTAPGRRLALVVLVVGSVLALAAAAGPAWSSRTGVVIAVGVALASNLLSWRDLRAERRKHGQALLRLSQAHGAALREERSHNARVVSTLTTRAQEAAAALERQQLTIGELHVAVATLEGRTIRMRGEARRRDAALASLKLELASREAEMGVLRAATEAVPAAGAQIHSLPRRSRHLERAEAPRADNDNGVGTDEGTVLADRHHSVSDRTSAELAVSLPNFEAADRRWA